MPQDPVLASFYGEKEYRKHWEEWKNRKNTGESGGIAKYTRKSGRIAKYTKGGRIAFGLTQPPSPILKGTPSPSSLQSSATDEPKWAATCNKQLPSLAQGHVAEETIEGNNPLASGQSLGPAPSDCSTVVRVET